MTYRMFNQRMLLSAAIGSLGLVAAFAAPAWAQQSGNQQGAFSPDPSVFEQLTDLQRQISILEREVVLEDLKLRRRELDIQNAELDQQELDRRRERERLQREEEERERQAELERQRQEALRQAEEELRRAELRAQQEAILRSLEEAAELEAQLEAEAQAAEEAALAAQQAAVEAAEDQEGVIVVPRQTVSRAERSRDLNQAPLIVTPNNRSESAEDPFAQDLALLTQLVGGTAPEPVPEPAPEEIEAEPMPEPEPVLSPPPVVRSVRGLGGTLRATLALPDGGVVDVFEGDRIPGEWRIVRVDTDGVFGRRIIDGETVDDVTRFAFGQRVQLARTEPEPAPLPIFEEPETFEPPPIAQGSDFVIPGGIPGFQ